MGGGFRQQEHGCPQLSVPRGAGCFPCGRPVKLVIPKRGLSFPNPIHAAGAGKPSGVTGLLSGWNNPPTRAAGWLRVHSGFPAVNNANGLGRAICCSIVRKHWNQCPIWWLLNRCQARGIHLLAQKLTGPAGSSPTHACEGEDETGSGDQENIKEYQRRLPLCGRPMVEERTTSEA